jgi:hypothetical protein
MRHTFSIWCRRVSHSSLVSEFEYCDGWSREWYSISSAIQFPTPL